MTSKSQIALPTLQVIRQSLEQHPKCTNSGRRWYSPHKPIVLEDEQIGTIDVEFSAYEHSEVAVEVRYSLSSLLGEVEVSCCA